MTDDSNSHRPPAGSNPAAENGQSAPAAAPPSLTLPKGGGAIRGIGEKFAANPVTGTGSMSVPIAVSPGRSGFGPQLSLSYDSGAGNGPFGFGWSLSLPSITRKTDKGLPRYLDAVDSDVFILSGAEDLVPLLVRDAKGKWVPEDLPPRTVDGRTYRVRRYRPRIEGLFARIERWADVSSPEDVHWRSISKDNILTLYGFDQDSRVADPLDASRIFSWLICESRDDRGNGVLYRYRAEDGLGVDLGKAHERNRGPENDVRRSANRYLKRIHYGNRTSLLDSAGQRPQFLDRALIDTQIANAEWMFEVVFDYGDHDQNAPKPNDDKATNTGGRLEFPWNVRIDGFSSYSAGFEVRTTRLCQRVLMFHHFPDEAGVGRDCLVRSTDFSYSDELDPTAIGNPVYTFLKAVTQIGYRRTNDSYDRRSLPPVEFAYTEPIVRDTLDEVDPESLDNLPIGLDGNGYRSIDLHGEGIPGVLAEQGGAWFYKRNLSPITNAAQFAAVETVAVRPNVELSGSAEFMDLAGDGQPDVVVLEGLTPGLYEHDTAEGWQPFRPFISRLNRSVRDPNLKFVDLDGDGHADVLITEDDAFVWHASLAEEGFGPARRVVQALDEEKGPRIVFADGTQSIYLTDLSGDGLTDIVRIRNGEVCYWPNLGYGHFGAKVAMDNAPWFDRPDQFDPKRIRLADIDGSGTTDIIYLHGDGVRLYFNQSGNSWSQPQVLKVFPRVDDLVSIVPADLLGNGTTCLVWSSPLPGDARRPMRYVKLMGERKPHLLIRTVNNLGAETRVDYAPSTKFYMQDKRDGRPWITRLPFPVHVVERVQSYDHISRNRFVTRYSYHHGYFDGEEREFRGFARVDQLDTEAFAALAVDGVLPDDTNVDAASHVPPVLTKTWFHTGVYFGGERISNFFAGLLDADDVGEYYREPGLGDERARQRLLEDTVLPSELTPDEAREACRALKGSMLRQEVYALDGTDKEEQPYTVAEQNFTIKRLQPWTNNRHGVFFTHAREALNYHYERDPKDPRVTHAITLEVDDFGNVLKSVAIGYGRKTSPLEEVFDRSQQSKPLVSYIENRVTNAIDEEDAHHTPLPAEIRTYELTGYGDPKSPDRFTFANFVRPDRERLEHVFDGEISYEEEPGAGRVRRLIEHVRTLYRKDDLSGLEPLGTLPPMALPGESYQLVFTPGLLSQAFRRGSEDLLGADPAGLLSGRGPDRGGYVASEVLRGLGLFPNVADPLSTRSDGDGHWWIPSGRAFHSPSADAANPAVTAVQELAEARRSFFLVRKFADPFNQSATVVYDRHALLVAKTEDALGNMVTAEHDYRVLAPRLLTDPNGNQSEVAFDILGMVSGTAIMGKMGTPREGDTLSGFQPDLTDAELEGLYEIDDPHVPAPRLLGGATTRIVYDLHRFTRTRAASPDDPARWQPVYAATLARETHVRDPLPPQGLKIQIGFSYSDGYGREIQKKIQAEPGPLVDGGPAVNPRWVGSGWTIFNNKGKPVRQYEPFFSQLPDRRHQFEFGVTVGVSPILFYDPVDRLVATVHPNHVWEKVVFDPWQQTTYDVNDTVSLDPSVDPDVGAFFRRLPDADYLPTWHALRAEAAFASELARRYPDAELRNAESQAAREAAKHANTPTIAHFDTLGRAFLTIAHNRFERNDIEVDEKYATRVVLDIEGNQRAVRDARVRDPVTQALDPLGRIVMQYDYDMLGSRIHQASMEAGKRWMLNDVTGKPIRAWDSRLFTRRITYDELRRPTGLFVTENGAERLAERTVYGEGQGAADNHRTRVFQVFDSAGRLTSEAYDFKGNLLRSTRDLLPDYKRAIDWQLNPAPNDGSFTSSTTYDALNRPTAVTAPDNSVYRPAYNEANLLDKVEVNLRGATAATPFVSNIEYDAKGQRTLIRYGNGAQTTSDYDNETFRLTNLRTTRPAGRNGLVSRIFRSAVTVQDLRYTYDPAGNITRIADAALATVTHAQQIVEPVCRYTYDAIYRLVEATGREHIDQSAFQFAPPDCNYRDHPYVGPAQTNDLQAVRNYIERYEYDPVGNFERTVHHATNGSWTRAYAYEEASLIEDGQLGRPRKISNRLTGTTLQPDGASPVAESYTHDAHGNMTRMPHLPLMRWDFEDQLSVSSKQVTNTCAPEMTFYVYDASGQRARKVTERQNGTRKDERVYLGGFGIYREYDGTGATVTLERETLHVMHDEQRIALVETKTVDIGNRITAPLLVQRYQLGNHLGSASLELDGDAGLISYDEYHPYGTTSYQAMTGAAEGSLKRYRYTGKERDEETGFNYHGARYYAAWLGRWTRCDPAALASDINVYVYAAASPMSLVDNDGRQPEEPPIRSRRPVADLKRRSAPPGTGKNSGADAWKTSRSIQGWLKNEARRTGSASPYKWRNPPGLEGGHPQPRPFKTHGDTGGPLKWENRLDNDIKGKLVEGHRTFSHNPNLPTESPTVEAPKAEAPKIKTPKVEAPKVETPKVETPKTSLVGNAGKETQSLVATTTKAEGNLTKLGRGARLAGGTVGKVGEVVGIGFAVTDAAMRETSANPEAPSSGPRLTEKKDLTQLSADVGALAGRKLEEALHVSDYSSAAGMKAERAAEKLGASRSTAQAIGVGYTVFATATGAVPVAVVDRLTGGRFARAIGLR